MWVGAPACGDAYHHPAREGDVQVAEVLDARCECDEPSCEEAVTLTTVALEALRRAHEPVLAPGHPIDRAREARRRASTARDDAQALRAQAAHARRRAEETIAALGAEGRVLVVNDSVTFLRAAGSVVLAADRLRWVGSVLSGENAVRAIPLLRPDLVLIDIHMPGLNGVETARIIHQQYPEILVVLMSSDIGGLSAIAQSVGASALLDKADLGPDVLDALWLKHRADN
jgi:two-component system, NarL family, invasion response regulator UvrY